MRPFPLNLLPKCVSAIAKLSTVLEHKLWVSDHLDTSGGRVETVMFVRLAPRMREGVSTGTGHLHTVMRVSATPAQKGIAGAGLRRSFLTCRSRRLSSPSQGRRPPFYGLRKLVAPLFMASKNSR